MNIVLMTLEKFASCRPFSSAVQECRSAAERVNPEVKQSKGNYFNLFGFLASRMPNARGNNR